MAASEFGPQRKLVPSEATVDQVQGSGTPWDAQSCPVQGTWGDAQGVLCGWPDCGAPGVAGQGEETLPGPCAGPTRPCLPTPEMRGGLLMEEISQEDVDGGQGEAFPQTMDGQPGSKGGGLAERDTLGEGGSLGVGNGHSLWEGVRGTQGAPKAPASLAGSYASAHGMKRRAQPCTTARVRAC